MSDNLRLAKENIAYLKTGGKTEATTSEPAANKE